MRDSQARFIRQQGFRPSSAPSNLYSALMLQPRIIGGVVAIGVVLQSPWLFFVLSAALWWSAIVPTHSLFDPIYNHLVANRRALTPLRPAPAPRRFAQGLSAMLAFFIGAALLAGATITAWIVEGLFVAAVMVLIVGRFCVGSYVHSLITLSAKSGTCGVSPGVTRVA